MIVIFRIGRQTLANFFLILASLSAVTSLSLAPLYPCAMKGVHRLQSSVSRRILHGCISSGVQLQAVISRTPCAETNVYAFDSRERGRESRVCGCMCYLNTQKIRQKHVHIIIQTCIYMGKITKLQACITHMAMSIELRPAAC
jgi:hypothetical protein